MRAEKILESGMRLLKSKGEDYTENRDENQYQNFERSNLIASWFKHDEDKSFAVFIGTKLARLASLLNGNKLPNNESILDSFIDGANYFALWGGKRLSKDILAACDTSGGTLAYDKPTPNEEKSNPSQEAECKIIGLVGQLTDKDLLDTSRYLEDVYKNRMMTNYNKPNSTGRA